MSSAESHAHPQQPAWSQQPHLLPPLHTQTSFPSPSSPSSSLGEQQQQPPPSHYPPYYTSGPSEPPATSLSLNLSSLTVASPTNLSPIHPSVSPITPISPSNAALHQGALAAHQQHHLHAVPQPFQFSAPADGPRYDDAPYDAAAFAPRRLTSSRSSSASDKSVPRKRSFTAGGALSPAVEEPSAPYEDAPPATSPYDEVEMGYADMDAENSPVDGSTSGGEQTEHGKPSEPAQASQQAAGPSAAMLGKPIGTNNFVTKLYQMINDPKSAQFISWTELGTSFVVSNVGEFSRTILGSHFKHNNFSSFVRQLNMYGFHKINRTPRAQRTSADVQTWEFSHHKFLRGRPDLLEEIKRKALEPDPSVKQRVELPGEVAAQLGQMRDENRRLVQALNGERQKMSRLADVTKVLYDVVTKAFPGHVPMPFPGELLELNDSPNIMITSPTSSSSLHHHGHPHGHFPPSLGALSNNPSLHSLHSLSPGSSPTAPDFPPHAHTHTPHSLSRQHSFQHMQPEYHLPRYDNALGTPLPPSPGPLDAFDDAQGRKRQRTGAPPEDVRKSRARSDSAPLGYGLASGWPQTRPRSGSGINRRREEGLPVPNIGTLSRGQTLPMLSIPGVKGQGAS